ncbi:hypothetical protein GCM10009740_14200 [Terrabacter terrae]|uniref:Uncharacterized protein n=1 Tax=Terrabacter terrae TaxID=318434 RepID=A0ABN2U1K9_9MICO
MQLNCFRARHPCSGPAWDDHMKGPLSAPAAPATPRDRDRLVAGFGWGGLAVTALAGLARTYDA